MNKSFLKVIGPGILFASTAIGVSHLVQSTRAGALFGYGLVWAIIAANLFKYPFFEFGSRYANVKRQSIIKGYAEQGMVMLYLYLLITLGSMFFVVGAVGAVTGGFFSDLLHLRSIFGDQADVWSSVIVMSLCALILFIGQYKHLDKGMKWIAGTLFITTLLVFVLLLHHDHPHEESHQWITWPEWSTVGFLIALMGWMPTAVDLSTWNSIWTVEKMKETGYAPPLKQTLLDFNIGYLVSAFLALCFVTIGSHMLQGKTDIVQSGASDFASQVVQVYTKMMGSWSRPLIGLAASSIMFGTCIAVLDGYSRALKECISQVRTEAMTSSYKTFLVSVTLGGIFIIVFFKSSMSILVDLATTISFLIAPVIAIANHKLVFHHSFPIKSQPRAWLKLLSYLGITFLSIFSLFFLIWKVSTWLD